MKFHRTLKLQLFSRMQSACAAWLLRFKPNKEWKWDIKLCCERVQSSSLMSGKIFSFSVSVVAEQEQRTPRLTSHGDIGLKRFVDFVLWCIRKLLMLSRLDCYYLFFWPAQITYWTKNEVDFRASNFVMFVAHIFHWRN